MAIYSRKEFCKLCGVSYAYINGYIKRGKVILTGKNIDTSIAENQAFMEARAGSASRPKPQTVSIAQVELSDDEKDEVKSLSLKKKILDTNKVEEEVNRLRLTNSKLRGEAVPIELVKNIVSQFSKSIISSFKDGAEGLLMEIAHNKKFSNAELARLRGVLIDIINGSTDDAIRLAKKDLSKLAHDYSVKRGRGENSSIE